MLLKGAGQLHVEAFNLNSIQLVKTAQKHNLNRIIDIQRECASYILYQKKGKKKNIGNKKHIQIIIVYEYKTVIIIYIKTRKMKFEKQNNTN